MDESSSKRMVLDVSGLTLLVAASTWSRSALSVHCS